MTRIETDVRRMKFMKDVRNVLGRAYGSRKGSCVDLRVLL